MFLTWILLRSCSRIASRAAAGAGCLVAWWFSMCHLIPMAYSLQQGILDLLPEGSELQEGGSRSCWAFLMPEFRSPWTSLLLHSIDESSLGPARFKGRGQKLYLLMREAAWVYREWCNCSEASSDQLPQQYSKNQIHPPILFVCFFNMHS